MGLDVSELKYNSQRNNLIIPEYGRNVQNLISHARNIEDDKERQKFVERVVKLMMQLNPQAKSIENPEEKIWMHVFRIADYTLKVTPPEGVDVTEDPKARRPEPIKYPQNVQRYRHYGTGVRNMIAKAREMDEGPVKDDFVDLIGAYMKMAYATWSKEQHISNEIIFEDLNKLSEGSLSLSENVNLDILNAPSRKSKSQPDRTQRKSRGSNQRRTNKSRGRSTRRK